MQQLQPNIFVADDKFGDVIRCLEARGWTRHPHLSFPKTRLKWTNYSKIPWTSLAARRRTTTTSSSSNGQQQQWLNHFQNAVLFSQKDVFARALYEYEHTAATAAANSRDGHVVEGGGNDDTVGVDTFYLHTFDLLRDDDKQLLVEWFLYSRALAILKSYTIQFVADDSALDELSAAIALLSAVVDGDPRFFSHARRITILDVEAPEWKALLRKHTQIEERASVAAAVSPIAPDLNSQVERILQTLRKLDLQFDAVGFENQSVWICKPSNLSQGRGIQLLTSLDDILALQTPPDDVEDGDIDRKELEASAPPPNSQNKWVVQKYMEQPLLTLREGRKFDIRQWVLIKSLEPLHVFWYHKCYLRFCSEPFGLQSDRLDDQFVHLSNFSIQKHAEGAAGASDESMWSSDTFQDYLRQQHGRDVWSETIVPQMQHATRIAILSTASKLNTIGVRCEYAGYG